MFPTRVLVAVDGSEEAEHAAREAARLCRSTGSELHVAYIAPGVSAWTGTEALAWGLEDAEYIRRLDEENEREGRELLEEQAGKAGGSGVRAEATHLRTGRADAGIADLAEELEAGLLVIGHRGYGGLKRALTGSVAMSLIHHAHCPVLVVRGAGEEYPGISGGPVLVAYDGSAESERAAEAGAELAASFGVGLHLASVVDMSKVIPYAPTYARLGWEEEIERAEKEARNRLEEAAARMGTPANGVRPTLHVRNGRPPVEIVQLGDELEAGLTLVGSRGLGGIRRALMGSVSTSVAQHAPGSVLVFRPVQAERGG